MLKINRLQCGDYLLIGNTKEIYHIAVDDILYIRNIDSNYVELRTIKKNLMPSGKMKEIKPLLTEFIEVSAGIIVNPSKITKIDTLNSIVFLDNIELKLNKPMLQKIIDSLS